LRREGKKRNRSPTEDNHGPSSGKSHEKKKKGDDSSRVSNGEGRTTWEDAPFHTKEEELSMPWRKKAKPFLVGTPQYHRECRKGEEHGKLRRNFVWRRAPFEVKVSVIGRKERRSIRGGGKGRPPATLVVVDSVWHEKEGAHSVPSPQ